MFPDSKIITQPQQGLLVYSMTNTNNNIDSLIKYPKGRPLFQFLLMVQMIHIWKRYTVRIIILLLLIQYGSWLMSYDQCLVP